MRKPGDHPVEYLTIKIDDVLVSSVTSGQAEGADPGTETLQLRFGHATLDYLKMKADGSTYPPITFKWDVTKAKPT